MADEFTRDELVLALRTHGQNLLRNYFKTEPDLEQLIRDSVGGNTFRSFRKMSKQPSVVFRTWAKDRLSLSVMEEFGQLKDQAAYDAFLEAHAEHLARYWQAEGNQPLRFGPGRKLLNLLFKRVARCTEVPESNTTHPTTSRATRRV